MPKPETSVYENLQRGYLSPDIFFSGDEKPTNTYKMPFEGTIGTAELVLIDSYAEDAILEKIVPFERDTDNRRVLKVIFSSSAASGVEYPMRYTPSHENLFSHRHQQ